MVSICPVVLYAVVNACWSGTELRCVLAVRRGTLPRERRTADADWSASIPSWLDVRAGLASALDREAASEDVVTDVWRRAMRTQSAQRQINWRPTMTACAPDRRPSRARR